MFVKNAEKKVRKYEKVRNGWQEMNQALHRTIMTKNRIFALFPSFDSLFHCRCQTTRRESPSVRRH
jgi:hypothetical protein